MRTGPVYLVAQVVVTTFGSMLQPERLEYSPQILGSSGTSRTPRLSPFNIGEGGIALTNDASVVRTT